jgi:bacteriocin resistance YdeI/OmpD-like protein
MGKKISSGTVHTLPADLKKALAASPKALAKWEDISALARNEWICWTISVKLEATRKDHVRRVISELIEGMRRPCCWIGCTHRTDKPISRSVQWVLDKKSKSSKLKRK